MVKVIPALLDKEGKEIFKEDPLKIKPLKNISKVIGFRFYSLNKKGTKSNRENLLKW